MKSRIVPKIISEPYSVVLELLFLFLKYYQYGKYLLQNLGNIFSFLCFIITGLGLNFKRKCLVREKLNYLFNFIISLNLTPSEKENH